MSTKHGWEFMKKAILSVLFLSSVVSQAADIQGIRSATAVRVNSVEVTNVGEHGWPVAQVKVQATFSNRCMVPKADELVVIANYSENYDALILSLGSQSDRMCTMEYRPVTVTINLGQYTKPNDGMFDSISVNQVQANLN